MTDNPLKKYFRTPKIFIKLPSNHLYYSTPMMESSPNGEIGLLPMTAEDEIITKNPDALLNGQAINSILKSCVPGLSNPDDLIASDVEVLLMAIRFSTFGDKVKLEHVCPKCKSKNESTVSIRNMLDSKLTFCEKEYCVNLENDLKVYVKPFTHKLNILGQLKVFEQTKIQQFISSQEIPTEEKIKRIGEGIEEISKMNFDQIINSIIKIDYKDNNQIKEISNKEHIKEFMMNIDSVTADAIKNKVSDANKAGIDKSHKTICSSCKHEWTSNLEFDPASFFAKGF